MVECEYYPVISLTPFSFIQQTEWFSFGQSYNQTTITWTTHNPEGLTIKDVEMAQFCDEQAKAFGEVERDEEVMSCSGVKKGGTL